MSNVQHSVRDPSLQLTIHFNGVGPMDNTQLISQSCFDSALIRNDIQQAEHLIKMGMAHQQTPRLMLKDYVLNKRGNEGYNEALALLVRNGVYEIQAEFVEHVISEFDIREANCVIDCILNSSSLVTGGQRKILHYAVGRLNHELYTKCILLQYQATRGIALADVNARDEMDLTPLFYFINGEFSFNLMWLYLIGSPQITKQNKLILNGRFGTTC